MTQTRHDVWSYSRTTCFGRCKYEFYLGYVLRDEDLYPSEGNYYAEVGSLVHETLEKIFKGELSEREAPMYFADNYIKSVCHKVKKSTMEKTYDSCVDYFLTADFSWLEKYEILGVELKQQFSIEGIDFVGYIDLLLRDKTDGRIVILDHKSAPYPFKRDGTVKKSQEHGFESYKKQMYLYCNAIYQQFGEYPRAIAWNHFKDGGQIAVIPFRMDEYEKSIRWFVDTIKTAEQEILYEPSPEYFYCSVLCNYRSVCEYREEVVPKHPKRKYKK